MAVGRVKTGRPGLTTLMKRNRLAGEANLHDLGVQILTHTHILPYRSKKLLGAKGIFVLHHVASSEA